MVCPSYIKCYVGSVLSVIHYLKLTFTNSSTYTKICKHHLTKVATDQIVMQTVS